MWGKEKERVMWGLYMGSREMGRFDMREEKGVVGKRRCRFMGLGEEKLREMGNC